MEGAAAIGASGGPISRNAGSCVQCSSCPYGCAIDAKRGMHVSYLPRAVAAGARIRSRSRSRGAWSRAAARLGSRCQTDAARGSVCSAPPLYGPRPPRDDRRLWRPGDAGATAAFRPRRRQVGRNLHIHPACWVGGRYEEEVGGWDGVMQSYYIDQWEAQRILLEATFTPLAFGGGWLLGPGVPIRKRCSNSATSARSVSTSPIARGPGRPARERLTEGDLQTDQGRCPSSHLRHCPRG